ncbi:Dihydroorotate dehydrogenase B (NAD(+)), electron transfer subunit [Planctomycetes bacterium Pan216]|uniref:Dihydroorotate dehydrogenase B (NAD(+)), electron transfer subunit n=1 Tax=Kolteria novifilia TaxID=2527975 RepID=A0A518B5Q3_9BACT|nr:Dihydroorotate dehydrogenase B (NAD(+)), electron transfer subunit [Planctomycetes bacterium Pan216]
MISQAGDVAIQESGVVMENVRIARGTYRLRIDLPNIAARILPGQFVMVRIAGRTDPLLARPFALYDTVDEAGTPRAVDIVYLVMGRGTQALSALSGGETLELWGPLGNTFPPELTEDQGRHLLILAGGIGQTPFVALIKELLGLRRYGIHQETGAGRVVNRPRKITVGYGVRSAEFLAGVDDFRATGIDLHITTEDGSAGQRGFVTRVLDEASTTSDPPTAVFACGPEPMLGAVSTLASEKGIPCWVSLETKMACGYGVCFSCVCPVNDVASEQGWDFRRVCIEGPVFPAETISWPNM